MKKKKLLTEDEIEILQKKEDMETLQKLVGLKYLQNDMYAKSLYIRIEKELKEAQKKNDELLQILRDFIFSC